MRIRESTGGGTYGCDEISFVTNQLGLAFENGAPTQFAQDHLRVVRRGDLNCDGLLNACDIDRFVLALTDPASYVAASPACNILNADCNGDGFVNTIDIDAFVLLLTGR
jgi:hypothetical protein